MLKSTINNITKIAITTTFILLFFGFTSIKSTRTFKHPLYKPRRHLLPPWFYSFILLIVFTDIIKIIIYIANASGIVYLPNGILKINIKLKYNLILSVFLSFYYLKYFHNNYYY